MANIINYPKPLNTLSKNNVECFGSTKVGSQNTETIIHEGGGSHRRKAKDVLREQKKTLEVYAKTVCRKKRKKNTKKS